MLRQEAAEARQQVVGLDSSGSLVLRPSFDAPPCSLGAPCALPSSLDAPSKAALLPFPIENGNPQS